MKGVTRAIPRLPAALQAEPDAALAATRGLLQQALARGGALGGGSLSSGPFARPVQWFYTPMPAPAMLGAFGDIVNFGNGRLYLSWYPACRLPLPSGDVSIRGARAVVVIGLIMMVAFGWRFGILAFGLLAAGTGLGIAYDLWFKRTAWSWLPYLLALPLLPIWVFTALGRPEPQLLLLYPLGALAAVGVHLAQALPDATIDREAGLETVTSRSGEVRTFISAWLATLTAPVLGWFAAAWSGNNQSFSLIALAAGFALVLLTINVILVIANRRVGTAACFPLVAIATLGSGLAWTLTVAR